MPEERTIELVNWCPFNCSYCSTDCIRDLETEEYHEIPSPRVYERLREAKGQGIDVIHISGGEPMIHAEIGWIMLDAMDLFGRGVVLHTNLIPQIAYNPNVLESIGMIPYAPDDIERGDVRVHCYMTPEDVDEVHILKRIKQGREAREAITMLKAAQIVRVLTQEPHVHCSANWSKACQDDCGHLVIRPDNTVAPAPCRKEEQVRP